MAACVGVISLYGDELSNPMKAIYGNSHGVGHSACVAAGNEVHRSG
jgi:hypothetical protein